MVKQEIISKEGYDYIKVFLDTNEEIYCQPGSIMYINGEINVETKSFGGIISGIKRKFLGGEAYFINKLIANMPTEIGFSSSYPGQIVKIDLNGEEIVVRDGAYLMHIGDIEISTRYVGLKGIFSTSGMFWLKIKGYGEVYLNVFGGIEEKIVADNKKILVDNGNLLGFDASLNVSLKKFGRLKTFIFGGEGFMFEISGNGRVYLQTKNIYTFISEIRRTIK